MMHDGELYGEQSWSGLRISNAELDQWRTMDTLVKSPVVSHNNKKFPVTNPQRIKIDCV